jgi:GNAT superfamily N-acetyltransferase
LSTALRISFEPDNETAKQFVTNSLDNFNIATTGQAAYWPVAYFLRGPDNEILGGLLGEIWGHWLHIKYIWVAEPARGAGHARTLVSAAEDYATRRGCVGAFLETFTFQARPLYEKLGYELFGELKGYPPGHAMFFLRKILDGGVT